MATATLRPTGDSATYDTWTLQGGTAGQAYTTIDEATTDDADYLLNNDTVAPLDRQAVTLAAMPEASSAISSVVIKYRSRSAFNGGAVVPFIRSGGSDTDGSSQALTTTVTDYSWDITSLASWTDSLINGLEIGWVKAGVANNTVRVTQAWLEVTYTPAGGGTTYPVTLTAGMTPAGALVKRPTLVRTGGATPAGALVKRITSLLTATLGSAGALGRRVDLVRSGALTPAGALSVIRAVAMTLTGAITPAGTLIQRVTLVRSGALTPAGALVKQPRLVLAGAASSTGTLVKRVNLVRAGAMTPSGALSVIRAVAIVLTGAIAPAGALVKRLALVRGGSLGPAGALTKRGVLVLTGAATPTGALTRVISTVIVGALGLAGAVTAVVSGAGGTILPLRSTSTMRAGPRSTSTMRAGPRSTSTMRSGPTSTSTIT